MVRAVVRSGCGVSVGCSAGADQAVLQAAVFAPSFLVVWAAFASSGAGAWSGSAVGAVSRAASAGASVRWLAGGPLSLPLRARLLRRSQAALAGACQAVFFQPGPGSLAVAGLAVLAGIPVFAFAPSAPAAPRGCAGAWSPVGASSWFAVFGSPCWVWVPSAVQVSLF